MSIEQLKNELPACAKDIKLNLSMVLTEEGAPDLNAKQIYSIALASAYATQNPQLIQAVLALVREHLADAQLEAAKSAAIIMAMNNIYYRFTHLVSDKEYATLPAKLRMNVIANSGIDKIDFELNCLAISAINGCGLCIDAHTQTLAKSGLSKSGIQSAVRIAAVMNAAAVGIAIAK